MTEASPLPEAIPDLGDPGVKVVRHSFGTGAALMILAGLFVVGAAVSWVMTADREPRLELEALPVPLEYGTDEAAVEQAVTQAPSPSATTAQADEASLSQMPREAAIDDTKLKEAVDSAFRTLDQQSAADLALFLSRFGNNAYAQSRGYVELARKAADQLAQEEEQEERRRRSEQQAVPWDMGVKPPEGID